jgi:hypothetical protein
LDRIRPRLTLILLVAALAGCEGRRFAGPLRTAADSMVGDAMLTCQPTEAGADIAGANPPMRRCAATRGDTAVTLLMDRDDKPVVAIKAIRVDPSRQHAVHDSIQFAIGEDYSFPAICAQGSDPLETERRTWITMNRQIALKNLGRDRVAIELRIDQPACERVRQP